MGVSHSSIDEQDIFENHTNKLTMKRNISPCLWFDDQAEEAARFYTTVFQDARIVNIARYPAVGQEIHGKPPGSVMTVEFELNGQSFTALNAGSDFYVQ